MAAPRLYWSTETLDLPDLSVWRPAQRAKRVVTRSDAGVSETVILETLDRVEWRVESFDDQSVYDSLVAWWSWAKRGETYGLALDSADTVDTTLAAAASAGATSVTVADATGIANGQRYRIRDTDGMNEEIVTVSSVVGTTVNLSAGLTYGYSSGAIFRSVDYYPSLETESSDFPVVENPGLTWTLTERAREAKSP